MNWPWKSNDSDESQYEEGGEWEDAYMTFERDGEYDIQEWMQSEWEAYNADD